MGGTYSMSSASSPRFIAATPTSSAVPGSTITTLWIISSSLVKVNATLLPAGTVITSRSYLRPGSVRSSISTSALPFHSAGISVTFLADVATAPLSSTWTPYRPLPQTSPHQAGSSAYNTQCGAGAAAVGRRGHLAG